MFFLQKSDQPEFGDHLKKTNCTEKRLRRTLENPLIIGDYGNKVSNEVAPIL